MQIEVKDNIGRLDNFLKKQTDINRSQIIKMIKSGDILVNNEIKKAGYIIKQGDLIEINQKQDLNINSEEMDLDIVYEDDDVIVINKANGIVVHPAPGHHSGTLVNGLLHHSKLSQKEKFRPGIVHRIDANTTGLLMVAKNNQAHDILATELAKKETYRKYIALVWGIIEEDTGTIDAPIGRSKQDRKKMAITPDGKQAITHFKVLKRYKNATLIELQLETGRTHQIRVHMQYIKHPVVNDPVYGKRKLLDDTGQMLHASELGFNHPKTGKFMIFTCPLPDTFKNLLNQFEEVNK